MDSVPDEVVYEILLLLDSADKTSFTATCRRFSSFRDDRFWKHVALDRDLGQKSWRDVAHVAFLQRKRASTFVVRDRAIYVTCFPNHDDPSSRFVRNSGKAAELLTRYRLKRLKRRGIRHGDVVELAWPGGRRCESFVYSSHSDAILALGYIEGRPVPPRRFKAIADFPIGYWSRVSSYVWCDLTAYHDEISAKLKPLNAEMYTSTFVYRKDHTGFDNEYSIIFVCDDWTLTDARLKKAVEQGFFIVDSTRRKTGLVCYVDPESLDKVASLLVRYPALFG